jgi:hypothetical protein
MTERDTRMKVQAAYDYVAKLMDMTRHGKLLQPLDLKIVMNLLSDCNDYFLEKERERINTESQGDSKIGRASRVGRGGHS